MPPCEHGLWVAPHRREVFIPAGYLGVGGCAGLTHPALFDSVTKTNLSVHEDKNRVPFVKVREGWALS